jgi:K+-transporting ATPase ATPase C chain
MSDLFVSPSSSPATLGDTAGGPSPIWRPALVLFVVMSVVTGLLYPLAVTGLSQMAFGDAAHGSLIAQSGKPIGSRLIGQSFSSPAHFWGRPSATAPMANNASASGGSNLGPSNPALLEAIQSRVKALRAVDPDNHQPIPVDLVTASASGLDPDISRAAADYQVARVARAKHLPVAQVQQLVDQHTTGVWLGFLGEARVNVLMLNLAIDALKP